jgi:hypothetical protein
MLDHPTCFRRGLEVPCDIPIGLLECATVHEEDNAACDAHETSSPDSICTSEWQIALKFFELTDNWPDHLGPAPGRGGCRVPPDLLECYGLSR